MLKTPVDKFASMALVTIDADATIMEAAQRLHKEAVSQLVVKERREVVGIISNKDIINRVIAKGRDPKKTFVRQAMTKKLVTIDAKATLILVAHLMHKKKKKRILIEKNGKIRGIITQTDLIRLFSKTRNATWMKKHTKSL